MNGMIGVGAVTSVVQSTRLIDLSLLRKRTRGGATHCHCGQDTRDHKPVCSDHIFEMPYVVDMLKRQQHNKTKPPAVTDGMAQLIYNKLPASLERLSKDLLETKGRIQQYLDVLIKNKCVKKIRKRYVMFVRVDGENNDHI